jgi:ParB-like chromosome segregation protein Spo0J
MRGFAVQHKRIDVRLLVPHPLRLNRGNSTVLQKLRRHIERTALYEPLTVRPHPYEKGKFQIINGHSRYCVLRALGHKRIACTVWEIDDLGADVAIATLNALSGNEIPERRAVLLGHLAARFGDDELLMLLPDKSKKLEALMRLARVELDKPKLHDADCAPLEDAVVLSFKLDQSDTRPVELALGLLGDSENRQIPPGQALGKLARFFLDSHRPETRTAKRRKVARA